MTDKTISTWDREGVFVALVEGSHQGPIILETEGENSSYMAAEKMIARKQWVRACICRVIPVSGNELLALDMVRMQPKTEEDTF